MKGLFKTINTIFESAKHEEVVDLSSEQLEMLAMSKDDIANGRLISEDDLDRLDAKLFSQK